MMITWKHGSRQTPWPPSFEQKVDLFYHRVLGWQLHVADLASNGGKTLADGEETNRIKANNLPRMIQPVVQGIFWTAWESLASASMSSKSNRADTP